MIKLRLEGKGPSVLGAKYRCDHSTIIYHCKRAGVQVVGTRGVMVVSSGIVERPVTRHEKAAQLATDFDGSPINPGRNYGEYMEIEARKRDILLKKINGPTQ